MSKEQQQIKFNPDFIREQIKKMIPAGFEVSRMTSGRYTIETKWKHGLLKKCLLDDTDVTNKLSSTQIQYNVENILKMAKKFRANFSGTIKFTCTVEGGKLSKLYVNTGSYILDDYSGKDNFTNKK